MRHPAGFNRADADRWCRAQGLATGQFRFGNSTDLMTVRVDWFERASLFPHELGWIDGERSPGWNGRRCNT
jgi:hypothetical protein